MSASVGPWVVFRDRLAEGDVWYVADAEGFTIADGIRNKAHADAIAAAPALYALLVELVDIEGPLPGTAAWAEKVRTALALATGDATGTSTSAPASDGGAV